MITPDELEILRKPEVQGYIVGTLKYVVPGDVLFHIETEQTFTVGKVNETEFQIIPDLQGYEWQLKEHLRFFLRIPDVYSRDPEKPERSLIGMCHHIACINPVTTIPEMTGEEEKIIEWKVTLNPGGGVVKQIYGDTLPLALLMALKWEVENGHK